MDRGETVTFESADTFSLRFVESPFKQPEKTVLPAKSTGDGWAVSAVVRDDAVYHHKYHYTVIMGDCSTDDPEIIIEQVNV